MKNKKMTITVVAAALVITGSIAYASLASSDGRDSNTPAADAQTVTMYKSPTCGCCVQHASYMEDHDFEVDVVKEQDMNAIKDQYNIPPEMESCHTDIVEGYIVEGHVPMEAIDRLLAERPDIDGIALPGMPSGSPGMPGPQTEPWIIYALKDGTASEWMTISN